MKNEIEKMNIFAVWKPKGISSFGVVEKVRRVMGEKRVGHAGTLDPLAEGVLVVGVGRDATKRLQSEEAKEKEYRVLIMLGVTSATDDAEGSKRENMERFDGCKKQPGESFWHQFFDRVRKVCGRDMYSCQNDGTSKNEREEPRGARSVYVRPRGGSDPPAREQVEKIVQEFIGEIEQIPPAFSAVHVRGKRAYALARRGKEVKLAPRKVFIKEIEVISYEWPLLELRVVTGKGVYIRALARDIGERLGVGGYVHDLVRTRVGEWTKENTLVLAELPRAVGKP